MCSDAMEQEPGAIGSEHAAVVHAVLISGMPLEHYIR
jgi:hypothetical protein